MRTSFLIAFSTAVAASSLVYGDYFQDYSQSNGSTFTDQGRGYSGQTHNNSNWQDPTNNWTRGEYKEANPNENSWTADSSLNQNQNSSSDQSQLRSNVNNGRQNQVQSQSNPMSNRAYNNRQQNYQKGAVADINQQRSYDSRSAPTNWENSESSGNSVWNTYYDNQNQNPPQNNNNQPQRQQPRPYKAPAAQPNTNQGAQWVTMDDASQTMQTPRYTDVKSAASSNASDSDSSASRFSNTTNAQDQNAKNSDLKVTRAVQLALTRDKSLSTLAQHVIVMTNNGQVYLRGNVNNDAEKSKVETIVRNVDGVKTIDNQLNVLNISSQ